jgi:hypothetical protein
MTERLIVTCAVIAALLSAPLVAQSPAKVPENLEVRFVVLGHIRGGGEGGLNPKLGELLDEVRELQPQFLVLTGDSIWGDYDSWPPSRERVTREWTEVDAALDTLGIPIYRVPGNHDISDPGTRDLWHQRYGNIPQIVTAAGIRLLLLNSTAIRDNEAGDRAIRGVDLDANQLRWLGEELAAPSDAPTFAFTHHLLWWEPEGSRWWREVHPMLARAGVKAVFSGDYGPLKFSSIERDGVKYFQTSMETPPSLQILQSRVSSRVLSAQFDNYLEVVVRNRKADVRVHTFGELSSGEFTPARYNAIVAGVQLPQPSLWARLMNFAGSPKRIAALLMAGAFAFGTGWMFGRRLR